MCLQLKKIFRSVPKESPIADLKIIQKILVKLSLTKNFPIIFKNCYYLRNLIGVEVCLDFHLLPSLFDDDYPLMCTKNITDIQVFLKESFFSETKDRIVISGLMVIYQAGEI